MSRHPEGGVVQLYLAARGDLSDRGKRAGPVVGEEFSLFLISTFFVTLFVTLGKRSLFKIAAVAVNS